MRDDRRLSVAYKLYIHRRGRVLRGSTLSDADELQPKFVDAMERAGR